MTTGGLFKGGIPSLPFFHRTPQTQLNPDLGNTLVKLQILDASSTEEKKIIKAEVDAEIADTKEKRSLGLSGRESLGQNLGMLFIFEKSDKYRFWMKGMKIPLDFIWINDTRVVDILKNIQPPKPEDSPQSIPLFAPIVPINRILEVNGGFVDTYNIRVGDKIEQVGAGEERQQI